MTSLVFAVCDILSLVDSALAKAADASLRTGTKRRRLLSSAAARETQDAFCGLLIAVKRFLQTILLQDNGDWLTMLNNNNLLATSLGRLKRDVQEIVNAMEEHDALMQPSQRWWFWTTSTSTTSHSSSDMISSERIATAARSLHRNIARIISFCEEAHRQHDRRPRQDSAYLENALDRLLHVTANTIEEQEPKPTRISSLSFSRSSFLSCLAFRSVFAAAVSPLTSFLARHIFPIMALLGLLIGLLLATKIDWKDPMSQRSLLLLFAFSCGWTLGRFRGKKLPRSPKQKQPSKSSTKEETDDDDNDEFLCPISLEMMEDPVVFIPTGQTYDKKWLCQWLLEHPSRDPGSTSATAASSPTIFANLAGRVVVPYVDNIRERSRLMEKLGDQAYRRFDDASFRIQYQQKARAVS